MPEPTPIISDPFWVAILVPPIVFAFGTYFARHPVPLVPLAILSVVLVVVIYVGATEQHGRELEAHLNSFDLDGDGIFGGPAEWTPEASQAMSAVVNDAGQNFAPIVGLAFGGLSSLLFYTAVGIARYMTNRTERAA